MVVQAGRGALLAKSDIQHMYLQIPVHSDDCHLLGMKQQGQVYIDAALPFSLCSAPLVFSAVADANVILAHVCICGSFSNQAKFMHRCKIFEEYVAHMLFMCS